GCLSGGRRWRPRRHAAPAAARAICPADDAALTTGSHAPAMPLSQRHLVPVVEPRRRTRHRPAGGVAVPPRPSPPPASERDPPSRALALAALWVIRDSRRPADRPAA